MESPRIGAVATLVTAVVDGVAVGPSELTDAFGRLGLAAPDLERAADLVHHARIRSEHQRRREHELAALFSSARELAEIRDTDELLERIVNRAHQIMGIDVTYLSELDPVSRELQVRTTVGAVTPELQNLRVPAGHGLVSEIVDSRQARWVGRYSAYARYRHAPNVDHAVEAEGLVSLLGVPMLTGDDVLGVLFVAARRESVFTPEQISVLSALADHASVVLQTAKMLRDLRRSEDEARQALERLTGHLAERDRANTVHQELVQAVLRGAGFGQIAGTLAAALSRPVAIVDALGRVAADSSGSAGPAVTLSAEASAALERSRASGLCVSVEGDEAVGAVAAMTAGAEHLGTLLLGRGAFDLGAVDRRTVERAAQVCALVELQQKAVADTERRLQTELLVDLLDAGRGDGLDAARSWREREGDIARRARSLDVPLSQLDTVHVFLLPGQARVAAVRALVPMLRRFGLVGEYRGYVAAVVTSQAATSQTGAAGQVTVEEMRARVASVTGASVLAVTAPPAASPAEIGDRFMLAMRTARLLEAVGATDRCVTTDEYLPYASIFDADSRSLSAFLEATIGAVRAYDRDRGTELLPTLRAFVRCNASPTRTARVLRFHTNTVLQRLDRLNAVLGEDWRSEERYFRISIAVRLDEVAAKLSVPGAGTEHGARVKPTRSGSQRG